MHCGKRIPTLIVEVSAELKQILIHCQGDMHLAVAKWKIEHLHKVEVKFSKPRIPYRETIRKVLNPLTVIKNNPAVPVSLVKCLCGLNPGMKA